MRALAVASNRRLIHPFAFPRHAYQRDHGAIHGCADDPRNSAGSAVHCEIPALFWGFIASMYVGNAMLLVLNLPLIGMWVRLLKTPYVILFPLILWSSGRSWRHPCASRY